MPISLKFRSTAASELLFAIFWRPRRNPGWVIFRKIPSSIKKIPFLDLSRTKSKVSAYRLREAAVISINRPYSAKLSRNESNTFLFRRICCFRIRISACCYEQVRKQYRSGWIRVFFASIWRAQTPRRTFSTLFRSCVTNAAFFITHRCQLWINSQFLWDNRGKIMCMLIGFERKEKWIRIRFHCFYSNRKFSFRINGFELFCDWNAERN